MRRRWRSPLYCLLLLTSPTFTHGQEAPAPLPEPLTLEDALALVESDQPMLDKARAEILAAQAERDIADADVGTRVLLEGRARWIDPAERAADQSSDDHKASLYVRKRLYDFGRTSSRLSGSEGLIASSQQLYQNYVNTQRLEVMQRYFDVLLADAENARANEAMATAYVSFDKLRDRHELGQVSDIDLLESENEYQKVRRQVTRSVNQQRITRAKLAVALGRPGQLPSTVIEPNLPQIERELPDYESLLEKALRDNLRVVAMRRKVDAATEFLTMARNGNRPYLDGELEMSEYSRETGSSDAWRAGVTLTVPLYNGGSVDAESAKRQANLMNARAALREAEQDVRTAVLETWMEIQALNVELDQVRASRNFRELYLDRSRADYEMEFKTDLGDSMVRLSESQYAILKNRLDRALAWERLESLVNGLPIDDAVGAEQTGETP